MTLKQLSDLYLQYQHSRVLAGALTSKHYSHQIGSLNRLMSFLGPSCQIESISTLDLQNHKRRLQSHYASVDRLNLNISDMKAMFHWARRNDVLEAIPNIDAISKSKIVHKGMYTFNSEQIKKLWSTADVKLQAMIWLGLKCGFGCTDCGKLRWKEVDFDKGRVQLPRNKTGVRRNLPLWSETVQALKKLPRSGPLVFYTAQGHPWVTTVVKTTSDGKRKYMSVNRITQTSSRLMKKAGIHVPKRTGLYALCRTAATLAARSGDPFAVQRLLGHVDLTMATRYVQDVSEQTDRVIENSRKYVIRREDVT